MENIKRTLLITIICLIPFICYAVKMTDFTEDTSPTSDDLIWTTNNPSGTPSDRKVSLGNLLLWIATQDVSPTGTWNWLSPLTISAINAAGESANALTLSGTLGAMDATGTDIFRGIYLNYTNANHTGGAFYGIDIADITEDTDAQEIGIKIGTGYDYGIMSSSKLLLKGDGSTTKGTVQLTDLDNDGYVAITPANETTSYTLTLPGTSPTGVLRADTGVMSASDTLSGIVINGGTASTVAAWDGSQNLTSLSSQNVITTGYIDGAINVTVSTSTPVTVSGSSGYYINGSDAAKTFNLPAAAKGLAYCFANVLYAKALTIHPASGDYIVLAGENNDSSDVVSTGANTDKICILGIDTTYWLVTASTGTWAND